MPLPDIDPDVSPAGTAALAVALVVYLGYLALVSVLWKRAGVDYPHIADNRSTIVRAVVVPIGIAAGVVLAATTVLGWWGPVLGDSPRADTPWWMAVAPVLVGLGAIVGVASLDWGSAEARRTLMVLALGCLFVGIAEEVLTRGLLLVGAREAGWSEMGAAVLATVLFSLLHLVNRWFGLSWGSTATQLVLSLVAGVAFYFLRTVTGGLLVPILVHALWDLGSLGGQRFARGPRQAQLVLGGLAYLAALSTAVAVLLT